MLEILSERNAAHISLVVRVYGTGSASEQHSPCSWWARCAHGRGAGEKPYTGIAPRHEGQLCFSGKALKEPSSPSAPISCLALPASPNPGFTQREAVLLASPELLGNRLRGEAST